MLGRPADELRLVICHLGHGCSASAVRAGRCVDTTMGFTPLEGLMMATRSGSIDPGIVLHVQQHHGLTAEQVESELTVNPTCWACRASRPTCAGCWPRRRRGTTKPDWHLGYARIGSVRRLAPSR